MGDMTTDPQSGLGIRRTDNGPKEGDLAAPQDARPLTDAEVAALIAEAGERNGDR